METEQVCVSATGDSETIAAPDTRAAGVGFTVRTAPVAASKNGNALGEEKYFPHFPDGGRRPAGAASPSAASEFVGLLRVVVLPGRGCGLSVSSCVSLPVCLAVSVSVCLIPSLCFCLTLWSPFCLPRPRLPSPFSLLTQVLGVL